MDVTWPPPNPAADALLETFLDLSAPGWRVREWAELDGGDVLSLLWAWTPLFKGLAEPRPDPRAEPRLDKALERAAHGAALDFSALDAGARGVLHARLLVALASAQTAGMTPGPVMRLPRGLSEDQRRLATSIRVLYGAPLSILGLD